MSRCRTQDTCSSIVLLPKFFTLQLRYAVFPSSAVTFLDADRSKYGPVRVASVASTWLFRLLLLLLLLPPGRFTWLAVSFVVVCCCCCCWGCCLEASRCEPFTVSLMSRKTAIHSMQSMYVLVIVILNVLILCFVGSSAERLWHRKVPQCVVSGSSGFSLIPTLLPHTPSSPTCFVELYFFECAFFHNSSQK